MAIGRILVHLSPDMGEKIKEAELRNEFYAFYIDAQTGEFGFFRTYSEDVFEFQRKTHGDWIYSEPLKIDGKEFTILKSKKSGDDDPDWELTAIDADRHFRICESFVIIGRKGEADGLSEEDMNLILSRMRVVKVGKYSEYHVLVVDEED